ncbi:MAG: hypothetical protein ACFFCW_22885 [Candidatus Hodarchaeota archaeon]
MGLTRRGFLARVVTGLACLTISPHDFLSPWAPQPQIMPLLGVVGIEKFGPDTYEIWLRGYFNIATDVPWAIGKLEGK